jgi:hypothetical protein
VRDEQHHHRQRERHRRQALAAEHQDAVDRRVPVRVERHQPVDRREEQGDAVEQQSAAAQPLHPDREPFIAGRGVLLPRPPGDQVRKGGPQHEVDGGAHVEERDVQVRRPVLQDLVVGDQLRTRPRVELSTPNATGRNASAMKGRTRLDASNTRRVTTPHCPPDKWWIIIQASEPSETPHQNRNAMSQARKNCSRPAENPTAHSPRPTTPTIRARRCRLETRDGAA